MSNIIVLTYDVPHRKTYDILTTLAAFGIKPKMVFATPFHYVKKFKPLYEHRPPVVYEIKTEELCSNLNIPYKLVENLEVISQDPSIKGCVAIIAGGGIIPESLCSQISIINAHPGILPSVRGLDAVKWSILEKRPVGVTVHYVTPEVDAGEIISKETVPVYPNDTFHSIAFRNYELEIKMMIDAVRNISEKSGLEKSAAEGESHKRMPHETEEKMMSSVPEYIKLFSSK